jgi:hypothetical protein
MRRSVAAVVCVLAVGCVPIVTNVRVLGVLPLGNPIIGARDLGANVSNGTKIRYFFGDSPLLTNSDGTLASNSGSEALLGSPLATTNFATAQVVPFTAIEAMHNLTANDFRWAVHPFGVVREGASDARIFYVVDKALPGDHVLPNGQFQFYGLFPMQKLGTTVLPSTQTVAVRDASEIDLLPDQWPTGFHTTADGVVHFFVQQVSDANLASPCYQATWTNGTFSIASTPAFTLDAVLGFSVFWNTHMNEWLISYVDSTGMIRLRAMTAQETLENDNTAAVYQIHGHDQAQSVWQNPWDGYSAFHIDGADSADGKTLLLVYSHPLDDRLPLEEMPVIEVTIKAPGE